MMTNMMKKLAWFTSLALFAIAGCASDNGHDGDSVDYTKTVKSADASVIEQWRSEDVSYVVVDVRT